MKTYLVDIYLASNLGDDLFLDHLAKSFPKLNFVPFYPGNQYDNFFKRYDNVKKFKYSIIDKVLRLTGISDKLSDYKSMAAQYDGFIFLGGGIFREESYWESVYEFRNSVVNAFLERNKNVFILGSNFGPWQTNNFYEMHFSWFKKVNKVCFRDQKSYALFSAIPQVVYAPDILWNYQLPAVDQKSKTVGISVIDPNHKDGLASSYANYVSQHQAVITKYFSMGYQVKLFSFCEKEGDLKVCNDIVGDLGTAQIEIFNYTGDIEYFLSEFGSCSEVIAARFHAVIIAMKYNIPVLPIIYGEKTSNLLEDLQFLNKSVDFNTLHELDVVATQMYVEPRIESFISQAHEHFKEL